MTSASTRLRSSAHAMRAACLVLLGMLAFAMVALPSSRGNAATAPTTTPPPRAELDVVLLLDTSNEVLGSPLATAQDIATEYIRQMPPEARIGVVTYGQFPTSMYRLSTNRTGSVGAIGTLSAEGNPAAYDGLAFAADQFDLGTSSKRQIVLIGPGTEQGSTIKSVAVAGLLRQRSIRLDTIIVDAPGTTSEDVDAIAASTGGSRTLWSDKPGITALADRTIAWSRPLVLAPEVIAAAAKAAKGSPLSNKLVLGVGVLMFFAGLASVLLAVTGPKQKRVNLAGVFEIDRSGVKGAKGGSGKKSGSTPMSGFAEKFADVVDKGLEKQGRTRGLNVTLERAGINMRPGEFLIVAASVLLAIFAVLSWWKGMKIAGIATGVLIVIGPRKYLARKANKRSMAFGDQLSDTLQLLSSSLRAGQGLMQAIDSVAREGDAPAADEFKRVVTETRLGRDLIDSLRAMADRVLSEDFNWVIPAIEINREVGGDLAEVLDTVAGTIRDRADIRRQVKTLSAEGRLSAYVLLSLPVGIAGFIQMANPDYLVELQTSPGYYLAGLAVFMMVVGGTWLFKLCKIDF